MANLFVESNAVAAEFVYVFLKLCLFTRDKD